MSSEHRPDSFLRRAPVIDGQFLDVNKLPIISQSVNDEQIEIGHAFDERPDLLADKLYGTSRLWWVFALRNPDQLKDPIRDFKAGTLIFLPSPESVGAVARTTIGNA